MDWSFCSDCTNLFDGRFGWALAFAALAGLVRGFSGFGAALIFVPLGGMLYGPVIAILLLWIIDSAGTLPVLAPHLRRANWREVIPLLIGSAALLPAGTWVLAHGDPKPLRWGVCLFVLACTLALASGWRYRNAPGVGMSLAVGGLTGFTNGSVGVGGPPLVLFWLGGQSNNALIVRSNIFAYFAVTTVIALGLYIWHGLFTTGIVLVGATLTPVYTLSLLAGDRLFRGASDALFRHIAFWICGLAAIAGLPIWR